ncbi:outer membrane protein assembly factor BamC [Methylococcus sp. EFPC2]|uniref:outer membrane protein assembly factor BamC n=1 Tax=Methylococcus sp. EFPC2 TaxID=2812648 RepID=UPI00196780BA|nr:outer membrane protein assembly factor BamC [Methylococcus sp. EFPC2]QSA97024.1 outer membrane protein assembly factor BamC [Methylococcus sp. EFPC2]
MSATKPLLRVLVLLGLAGSLSACSVLESLFPDKQKQYRYSSDIPALEIPPDLTSSTLEGTKGGGGPRPSSREAEEESPPSAAVAEENTGSRRAASKPAAKPEVPRTTLAQSNDNATLIEVEAPYAETWNDVSRALGRLEVELTDQNRSDGVFYVYYGGTSPKPKEGDSSLWQDLKSMFSNEEKASEYHVKLEEAGDVTNVFVLDASGKSVSEGPGYELLQRLNETLRTLDQPESEAEGRKDKGE